LRSRLALNAARDDLIEQLGDWMCGGSCAVRPSPEDVAALGRLYEAKEEAEARYDRCIAVLSSEALMRARRRAVI
jgi:hypothetical protein